MNVIVTDNGFAPDTFDGSFVSPQDLPANASAPRALDLPPDFDARVLEGHLDGIELIRVDFPSFADGRGFSVARALRRLGFRGRLRAHGHVLADQYAMARRSGFDEVEISEELAVRQPEPQWLARADWQQHDYRSRLAS